jgi:hypothetical protein
MKSVLALPAAALALALTGCGGDKRAEVTGTVSVAGKGPLSGGMITFVSAADPKRVSSGVIAADGKYRVGDAPTGACKVTVDNSHLDPSARKSGMGGMPGMPGAGRGMGGMKGSPSGGPPGSKGPPADAKAKMSGPPTKGTETAEMGAAETANSKFLKLDPTFANPESSPLTATVTSGSNDINFEVK